MWASSVVVTIVCLWAATALRWLTPKGAVAAGVVGAILVLGLGVGALGPLAFFFVSSSWLTRVSRAGRSAPLTRTDDADAAGRDAGQVLANAGVAALAALPGWPAALPGSLATGDATWIAAAGALAAATSDTWASEVGQRIGGPTRLITTGRRVAPGVDGGVSWAGTTAGLAGAVGLALVAAVSFGRPDLWPPLAAAGAAGMSIDSLAGATIETRWARVGNDAVNWLATFSGAAVALILA